MSTTTQALDMAKAQTFAFKIMGDGAATQMGTLSVIGDRLGLFHIMAMSGPLTADAFAAQAKIHPRYAREWLSAMACHGYVVYDDATEAFSLTPEQAACLVDENSPLYLGGMFGLWPDLWRNIDPLTDAYKHGGGVPQDRFGAEFCCGFERFSRPAFVNNLVPHWLPAMPEIDARLRAGGSAADVGCGNGLALIELAKGYPAAKLDGYDLNPEAIAAARANAVEAGVGDRLRFEVLDAGEGLPESYDLITCFDVVHDMPHPIPALRAIREALAPGSSFFVLEFNLFSDLQANIDHPFGMGAFGYSASVNYCMTTALAAGGVSTGTCMGERRFRELATEAGFGEVRRHDFPTNPLNLFFEAKA